MPDEPALSEVEATAATTDFPAAWKELLRRHMESTPSTQAISIDDSRESIYDEPAKSREL